MKILALDTSTQSCSVAVVDGDRPLTEITVTEKETHAVHLMTMVDRVMAESGLPLTTLDGFAVVKGPGSFTGLRIGLSTAKGLARACDRPVVGVSGLLALAHQAGGVSCPVHALIDAYRGEVYSAVYRYHEGVLLQETDETAELPENTIRHINGERLFIGNGAVHYRDNIRAHLGEMALFAPAEQNIIHAIEVARIGLNQLKRGESEPVDRLVPHYIRRSDAEINFLKKTSR